MARETATVTVSPSFCAHEAQNCCVVGMTVARGSYGHHGVRSQAKGSPKG